MGISDDNKITNIDDYIAQFKYDDKKFEMLNSIRTIIANKIPEATEKISWSMPTFYLHGNIIHFAMHKTHLGIYPGPNYIESFTSELTGYKTSKGAVQIPLDSPLPKSLIENMVSFNIVLVNDTL